LPTIPRFDLPEGIKFEQSVGVPRPRLIVRRPPKNAASGKVEEDPHDGFV